jgi:hypothetical protein
MARGPDFSFRRKSVSLSTSLVTVIPVLARHPGRTHRGPEAIRARGLSSASAAGVRVPVTQHVRVGACARTARNPGEVDHLERRPYVARRVSTGGCTRPRLTSARTDGAALRANVVEQIGQLRLASGVGGAVQFRRRHQRIASLHPGRDATGECGIAAESQIGRRCDPDVHVLPRCRKRRHRWMTCVSADVPDIERKVI